MQHITGGGWKKLKKRLHGVDVFFFRNHAIEPQEVFREIYHCNYADDVLYSTFNCGVGFMLAVEAKNVESVIKQVGGHVIGEIRSGLGNVIIQSKFSNRDIVL